MFATLLLFGSACSNKQLASSSGDQSITTKNSAVSPAPGQTESVQPDRVVSVDTPPISAALRSQEGGSTSSSPSASPLTPGSGQQPAGLSAASRTTPAGTADTSGIGDIYFDFDQYTIRPDAQTILERDAQAMKQTPKGSYLIEGHCDERGTLAYNLVLGEKRASAAKRYLENLGVPAGRLHTTSYGEVRPQCREHNEGCWKYNRRAHFVAE
ncbi:MAG: OmpA family protein [Nitrospira sp.]